MNKLFPPLPAPAFAALALLAAALPAPAQVSVVLRSDHHQYLQYEPLWVTVTIQNQTPAPLVFGPDPGAAVLEFDIETAPDRAVPRTESAPPPEAFTVAPWTTEARRINLLERYAARRQGPLRVVARATLADLDFRSNRLLLDILPGLELSRLTAFSEEGTRRIMTLRTLIRARHNHVFLQILDENLGVSFATLDLGPIIRHFPPQLRLSSDATIHVLHQSAPRRLTHSVTTLEGRPVSTVFHGLSASAEASLTEDRRGRLHVTGTEPYTGDPVTEPVRLPTELPRRLRP